MRAAVIDTNVLVSALLKPEGPPGQVIGAVRRGVLQPVFSSTIVQEYETVLLRPRLKLDQTRVESALDMLRAIGRLVADDAPLLPVGLPDPADWPFIACAVAAACPIITGNIRHFPPSLGVTVMTPRDWVNS